MRALTEPVRWLDVMHALDARGVTDFVETGPGQVLTNLVKKSLAAGGSPCIARTSCWPDARAAVRDAAASDPAAAATATPMPWDRQQRAAALASVAMAVPERVVTNETVAEGAGVTEQWIVHRTGVHERRYVSPGERLQDLAAAAGRAALDEAGVAPEDVDLVLVATVAADEILPNAAPLVARELGATRAGAMDVGAACTGFLSALALAAAQVEGGRSENVLVIGADVLSRFIDRTDRGTAALFADGAGAALVAPANGGGGHIGHIVLNCDGPRSRLHPRLARRADHPHAGPRHLQVGGASHVRVVARGHAASRPRARRHRPVRLPPGERAHPRRGGRAARPRRASA